MALSVRKPPLTFNMRLKKSGAKSISYKNLRVRRVRPSALSQEQIAGDTTTMSGHCDRPQKCAPDLPVEAGDWRQAAAASTQRTLPQGSNFLSGILSSAAL
jgi:hypothetical protein